jgi:coenzyme F420-reducing hydrogenase delta subunit
MSKPTSSIVVFACNWDGLSCIEAAAQAGLHYPASVRVVRVSCLSRVHQGLMLKAFELGAEGVLLLGCKPDNCQFNADTDHISREYEKARMILKLLGLGEDRLIICHAARGDGSGFVGQVTDFITQIERMRPTVPAGA